MLQTTSPAHEKHDFEVVPELYDTEKKKAINYNNKTKQNSEHK